MICASAEPRSNAQERGKAPFKSGQHSAAARPARAASSLVRPEPYPRIVSGSHVASPGKKISTNTITTMIRNIGIAAFAI
jgi:hypothetical protein